MWLRKNHLQMVSSSTIHKWSFKCLISHWSNYILIGLWKNGLWMLGRKSINEGLPQWFIDTFLNMKYALWMLLERVYKMFINALYTFGSSCSVLFENRSNLAHWRTVLYKCTIVVDSLGGWIYCSDEYRWHYGCSTDILYSSSSSVSISTSFASLPTKSVMNRLMII